MHALNPALDLGEYFQRVARARERVLLLDYDGTLAPFHARPERVAPYTGVSAIVNEITRSGSSRVVLVCGRELDDLQDPLTRMRGVEAWGEHGWQHCSAEGVRTRFQPGSPAHRGLQLAAARTAPLQAFGARLEHKNASLAVHWRGLDADKAAAIGVLAHELWRELAGEALEVRPFDGGLELRARGRDKSDVVREVLDRASPGAAAAYLGDDLADEVAFDAIRGRGLGVLVRPRLRATRADLWLAPPRELLDFLRRWHAAANRRPH